MKTLNEVQKIYYFNILNDARVAAQEAVDNCGIVPAFGNCGFAWVNISARGNFAKFTKELKISDKAYPKGRNIWYSRVYDSNTQSMDIHKVACNAFAKVLIENGIKCSVGCRLD